MLSGKLKVDQNNPKAGQDLDFGRRSGVKKKNYKTFKKQIVIPTVDSKSLPI